MNQEADGCLPTSASVVAAYLMATEGLAAESAIAAVRTKRPASALLSGYVKQLRLLEAHRCDCGVLLASHEFARLVPVLAQRKKDSETREARASVSLEAALVAAGVRRAGRACSSSYQAAQAVPLGGGGGGATQGCRGRASRHRLQWREALDSEMPVSESGLQVGHEGAAVKR